MVAPIDADWADNAISDGNLNKTTYGQGTADPPTLAQFTTRVYWRTDRKRWEFYNGTSMVALYTPTLTPVTTMASIPPTEVGGIFMMNFDGFVYYCYKHWKPLVSSNKYAIDRMSQYTDQTDFDNNFPTTVTADIRGDPANDRVNFNINAASTTAVICYKDYFGAISSDSLWTLRFKLVLTTVTQGDTSNLIMVIGMGSATAIGAEDFIGIKFNINNTNKQILLEDDDAIDPVSLSTGDSVFTHALAVETLYVQIKRTSTTAYTVQLFSDAEYSTSVEGPKSAVALASTVQNLRYFQIQTRSSNASATSDIIGSVTDIEFYDGTVTPQR